MRGRGAHASPLADARTEAAAALAQELGAGLLDLDRAYGEPCEVLSPNALGGVLSAASIPTLQCRVVCGAANNQLLRDPDDAALLAERGILYAPDYVVNAGGLIQVAVEREGYDAERARARRPRLRDDARDPRGRGTRGHLDCRGGAAARGAAPRGGACRLMGGRQ